MISSPTRCVICDAPCRQAFLEMQDVPILCNQLYESEGAARAATRGDIRLALCENCGVIFNGAFDPAVVYYNERYQNALHYSAVFATYAKSLVERLKQSRDLLGKAILEVGCGDGWFLTQLCKESGAHGIGVDPAASPSVAEEFARENNVELEILTAPVGGSLPRAELILCRHVLEHVNDPVSFLRSVVRDQNAEALIYIETPNANAMLQNFGIWDVLYEHCLYLTDLSTEMLLNQSGLTPCWIEPLYGDQFLGSLSMNEMQISQKRRNTEWLTHLRLLCDRFSDAYDSCVGAWRDRVFGTAEEGKSIAIWGAGSKGVMFLNLVDPKGERISAAIDLNPHKHGCYVPGTGTPILGQKELCDMQPDLIVVMNPLYFEEVRHQATLLGLRGSVEVAGGIGIGQG